VLKSGIRWLLRRETKLGNMWREARSFRQAGRYENKETSLYIDKRSILPTTSYSHSQDWSLQISTYN